MPCKDGKTLRRPVRVRSNGGISLGTQSIERSSCNRNQKVTRCGSSQKQALFKHFNHFFLSPREEREEAML